MFMLTIFRLLFVFIWITFCNCDHGHKEGRSNYVTIREIPATQRGSDSCVFPPNLTLSLNSNDGTVITMLVLRQQNVGDVNRPLLVIRKSTSGDKVLVEEEIKRTETAQRYVDPSTVDTFVLLRCKRNINGQSEVHMMGTVVHSGKEYSLTTDHSSNQPFRAEEMNHSSNPTHDYRTLPNIKKQVRSKMAKGSTKRNRRQVSIQKPYIIDVLVVIDYSIYNEWYSKSVGNTTYIRDQNTKDNLRLYFSQFINEISVRYQGIEESGVNIKVKVVGFIVADRVNAYPWTELRKEPGTTKDILDADNALKDFKNWVGSSVFLPPHDHAILFTGYDLYTRTGEEKAFYTAGLAYIGSMCRNGGDSVSVVEDHGGFQNVGTATHEIGHSLGAFHDGENNTCNSTNHYIMSSHGIGTAQTNLQRLNQWHFSSCTLNYFKKSISTLLREGYTCLTETFNDQSVVDSSRLPGQVYSPDEQCQLIWGEDSYLCRGSEFGNSSSICTAMYCRDPSTVSDCVMHTAARGTSCGNKKWCEEGMCTFSETAPERNEQCVLGDQPGIAFINKTCEDLVRDTPSYCYKAKVRARCCQSCLQHYTWMKGCEYGDRVKGCQSYHCNMVTSDESIKTDCCDTCSYGVKIPTTEQHTYIFDPITTIRPSVTSSTDACVDTALVNGETCAKYIDLHGQHLCYDSVIQSVCCESCNRVKDDLKTGCEYGDRHPSFCSSQQNVNRTWCGQYDTYCCKLCEIRSGSSVVVSSLVSIVITFIVTLLL